MHSQCDGGPQGHTPSAPTLPSRSQPGARLRENSQPPKPWRQPRLLHLGLYAHTSHHITSTHTHAHTTPTGTCILEFPAVWPQFPPCGLTQRSTRGSLSFLASVTLQIGHLPRGRHQGVHHHTHTHTHTPCMPLTVLPISCPHIRCQSKNIHTRANIRCPPPNQDGDDRSPAHSPFCVSFLRRHSPALRAEGASQRDGPAGAPSTFGSGCERGSWRPPGAVEALPAPEGFSRSQPWDERTRLKSGGIPCIPQRDKGQSSRS